MVLAISFAVFFVSGLLLFPFFLVRSVRAIADFYGERAIVGSIEMAAKQADRVSVIRSGREIVESRLRFLPGWLRRLASAKVVSMLVEKVWKLLTGNLRVPVIVASWLYLLLVVCLLGLSIVAISLTLESSALPFASVLCGSIVLEYLVSRLVVSRLCRELKTEAATQAVQ